MTDLNDIHQGIRETNKLLEHRIAQVRAHGLDVMLFFSVLVLILGVLALILWRVW